MTTDIEALKYNETLELPKFKAGLDRLLNRKAFEFILTMHHIQCNELLTFVDKAVDEGNAVLILQEYGGYCCIVWKD